MITEKPAPVTAGRRDASQRFRLVPQLAIPVAQLLAAGSIAGAGEHLPGLAGLTGPTLLAIAIALPLLMPLVLVSAGFVRAARGSRRPAAEWWRAGLAELPNTLRVYDLLLPFRAGFRQPAPAPQAAGGIRPAVLLLHGYGCNRGIWAPTARWLAARGHPVEAIDLTPLTAGIDDYRQPIQAAVDRLRTAHGDRPVAIVAHSMGGLAARAWLRDCARRGASPRIVALVTLATPHQGARLACKAPGRNARQMQPGSRWLEQLALEQPRTPPSVAVTTLIGWNDNIVEDPDAQGWAGARTIRLRHLGHLRFATSPRVRALVARCIDRAARHRSGRD